MKIDSDLQRTIITTSQTPLKSENYVFTGNLFVSKATENIRKMDPDDIVTAIVPNVRVETTESGLESLAIALDQDDVMNTSTFLPDLGRNAAKSETHDDFLDRVTEMLEKMCVKFNATKRKVKFRVDCQRDSPDRALCLMNLLRELKAAQAASQSAVHEATKLGELSGRVRVSAREINALGTIHSDTLTGAGVYDYALSSSRLPINGYSNSLALAELLANEDGLPMVDRRTDMGFNPVTNIVIPESLGHGEYQDAILLSNGQNPSDYY